MSSTRIRGNTQIMDYTVDLGRLEQNFLNGSMWDITDGAKNAGIRGVRLTPLVDDELTSKYYVDSLVQGIDWHTACEYATKTDVGGVYTSTGGVSGTFTGINTTSATIFDKGTGTILVGQRILVKDQADSKQNGIYTVTSTGATGGLIRSTDFDGVPAAEIKGGDGIFISDGVLYKATGWVVTGAGLKTPNVDPILWTQISGVGVYVAGNAIDISGNVISVKYDNTTIGISTSTGALQVRYHGITDDKIDWGTGAGQVSGADIPIADLGGYYGTDNVEDALAQLGAADLKFKTIDTPFGTDPVATSSTDTLTLQSSSGAIAITGNATFRSVDFTIAAAGVKDTMIDFGTGAGQVSGGDIPIVDAGGYFAPNDVESALQQLGAAMTSNFAFGTFVPTTGANIVADMASDTATLTATDGVISIAGTALTDTLDFTINAASIKDSMIKWGTSTGEVSAVDMPILDAGNYFGTHNVEYALQTLAANTPGIAYTEVWAETPSVTHNSPTVTLAHTPTSNGVLRLFLNGERQLYGARADYTRVGAVITFMFNLKTSPGQTDVVLADYQY